jgi:hypothetical protein
MDIDSYTSHEKSMASRLILEEMSVIKESLNHSESELSLNTLSNVWNEVANEIIYNPKTKQ